MMPAPLSKPHSPAFTMVEILAALAIGTVMLCLAVPALNSIQRGGAAARATYDIAGIIENARSYAAANNTYVFVGFDEIQSRDKNCIAVAVVSSKDGTRGYDVNEYNGADGTGENTWSARYSNGANLTVVTKLRRFENLHLAEFDPPPATGSMARPAVSGDYSLGSPQCVAQTSFSWPLGNPLESGEYQFQKVINFDPQGTARIKSVNNGDSIPQWMELDLQPTQGSVIPPVPADQNKGNQAVIQINGITGETHVYQP